MTLEPIPPHPQFKTTTVRSLPIQDNGEPLVPASLKPEHILVRPRYYQEGVPGALPECFVRESVWEKLLQAAQQLPEGYRFVLLDTWRPLEVQRWLYEKLALEIKWGEVLVERADAFVSRPMKDVVNHPPYHLTGGAVDLTIADDHGRLLDMGSSFDATRDESFTRHFELQHADDIATRSARENRRLLYHAMTSVGFVNIPSEWWHFDYGDQLWAWMHDKPHAIYGGAQPPFRWRRHVQS